MDPLGDLFSLVYQGKGTEAVELIEKHKDSPQFEWGLKSGQRGSGYTILHLAASLGDHQTAEMLLPYVPDAVNRKDDGGRTPLILASERGFENVVALLLDSHSSSGKAPDLEIKDEHERTALLASYKYAPIVKLLIDNHAEAHASDDQRRNLLHLTCMSSQLETLKVACPVLKKWKFLFGDKDNVKKTPCIYSAIEGEAEALEILLDAVDGEIGRLQIDAQDAQGNTAYHWACMLEYDDVCKWLKLHGASSTLLNGEGKTAEDCYPTFFGKMPDKDTAVLTQSALIRTIEDALNARLRAREGAKFEPVRLSKQSRYHNLLKEVISVENPRALSDFELEELVDRLSTLIKLDNPMERYRDMLESPHLSPHLSPKNRAHRSLSSASAWSDFEEIIMDMPAATSADDEEPYSSDDVMTSPTAEESETSIDWPGPMTIPTALTATQQIETEGKTVERETKPAARAVDDTEKEKEKEKAKTETEKSSTEQGQRSTQPNLSEEMRAAARQKMNELNSQLMREEEEMKKRNAAIDAELERLNEERASSTDTDDSDTEDVQIVF